MFLRMVSFLLINCGQEIPLSLSPWSQKSNNTDVSSIILLTGSEKTSEGIYITKISYDLNASGMTKTTQVYSQDLETSAAYKTIGNYRGLYSR